MGKVMINASLARAVIAVALMIDGVVTLMAPPALRADLAASGLPVWTITAIGGSVLIGGVLYAVPRSFMIGAILATGFLGGAICANTQLGEFGSPPLAAMTLDAPSPG